MFNLDFDLTWSVLKTALGCDHDCSLDLNFAIRDFDKTRFWKAIFGSSDSSGPTALEIHNPTLRFIHYWMFFTLFPGTNGFHLQDVELKLLFAMVKKRKVSPAKVLVRYWRGYATLDRPICFTSFITRLAESFGLLDSHEYACIYHPRDILGEEFFIRMGVLKKGPNGEFIMVYSGHTAEILLPCEQRQLYRLRTLTIKLDPRVEPDFAVTRRDGRSRPLMLRGVRR